MTNRDVSPPLAARLEGGGSEAAGNDGVRPDAVEGDSPTEGTVDGPLAPQALPGGPEGEPHSEMRPKENDPRQSDGLATFQKMVNDAGSSAQATLDETERLWQRPSPYNLHVETKRACHDQ